MREPTKRLGRGLSALFGEDVVPRSVDDAGVRSLAVDLLEPSPFQARRDVDPTALRELADSIMQRGILQPLLVRPNPAAEGRFQIIAGERRWRAAQLVPLHEVPALVRDLSDVDAMAAGLVENLQREDLNPVEEAEGFRRLMVEFKLTQEVLAEAVGKPRAHIAHLLRILRLPDRVLAMVRDGSLSLGHARALTGHAEPAKAARAIVQKQLTVRQAEEMVMAAGRSISKAALRGPRGTGTENADIKALQDDLSERLGLVVRVVFRGKSGSVRLDYESLDQLDAILKLLNG
jgi:ParB family chromosome partitioning protein